jgi:hypothetical protein
MFEILQQSTPSCLVAHFGGKVSGQEYQQFLDAVEERLKGTEPVSLVLVMTGLEFYGDFDAAKKDWKFTRGEYNKVRKSALVGDQKWIDWYLKMARHPTTEEKHFAEGQTQAAIDWACA